jgi:PPOX class probable F420-dependent enzyme
VATPLSVVADGDRLLIRSYEKSGKARRIRRRPEVEIAPSTARGKPTGPALRATARLLDGADSRRAARLLDRKYPGLHGIVVTWGHRLSRAKVGATIHYELVPDRAREPILEEREGATATAERNEMGQRRRKELA